MGYATFSPKRRQCKNGVDTEIYSCGMTLTERQKNENENAQTFAYNIHNLQKCCLMDGQSYHLL